MKKMRLTLLLLFLVLAACVAQNPKKHRGDQLFLDDVEIEGTLTAPGFGGGSTDTANLDYRLDTTGLAVDIIKTDLVDTDTIPYSQYPFRMGSGLDGDSAGHLVDYYMGGFYAHEDDDTVFIVELPDITAYGWSAPSAEVTIEYDDNTAFSSPVTIWTGTVTGTATTVSSFTNDYVPPGNHIRCYIDTSPATDAAKANRVYVPMIFY